MRGLTPRIWKERGWALVSPLSLWTTLKECVAVVFFIRPHGERWVFFSSLFLRTFSGSVKKKKTDWKSHTSKQILVSFCHTIHSILSFQPNIQSCKYYKYVPFVFIQAFQSNPILIAIPLNYDLFCLRLCYQQTPDTWYLPRSVSHPSRVINCAYLWELSGRVQGKSQVWVSGGAMSTALTWLLCRSNARLQCYKSRPFWPISNQPLLAPEFSHRIKK